MLNDGSHFFEDLNINLVRRYDDEDDCKGNELTLEEKQMVEQWAMDWFVLKYGH